MNNIAIPIDIKTRELDGKVWLAHYLALQGYNVIIGDKVAVRKYIRKEKSGVYIAKSCTPSKEKMKVFQTISQKYNWNIAVMEAEGGVFQSLDSYVDKRVKGETLDYIDLFFTWGKNQKRKIIENTPLSDDEVLATGNPRFDLLHSPLNHIYKKEGEKIRDDIGRYILINTNFARVNHYDAQTQQTLLNERGIQQKQDIGLQKIYQRFFEMIKYLSGNHDNIVVRPHPSENINTYHEKFDCSNNIIVDNTGDVRSWIMGSDAVIHNSCTTGIEAYVLGKPVFSYLDHMASSRPQLPNEVSTSVDCLNSLRSKLDNLVDHEMGYVSPAGSEKKLKGYFHNSDTCSVPLIKRGLEKLSNKKQYNHRENIKDELYWELWSSDLIQYVRDARHHVTEQDYRKHKFPDLNLTEVEELSNEISRLTEYDIVHIEELSNSAGLFKITG